ncbi:MAG: sulfur carrier protein ThiS [Planctomycetota bacterium]|jgi:thiamine biosynthesis protein ThiS|nr:sulfur carrier protein ThiS [Planctomycetota bacterium]MDP6763844.1 sulfur carrier protein ThiS [Planctomycetota bacterium]MDP6988832.1 sulfur carrier protein ThiS [Planctomycetota bacterium]
MKVEVNGVEREVPESLLVSELLESLDLEPTQAAVELNRVLVPRGERADTRLSEGDRVEVVTLVGGG